MCNLKIFQAAVTHSTKKKMNTTWTEWFIKYNQKKKHELHFNLEGKNSNKKHNWQNELN
jgi:hypothetical protein